MFYVISETIKFQICIHSSQKVRKGLVVAIKGLLSECFYTLGESRLMLLVSSELVHRKYCLLELCPIGMLYFGHNIMKTC